MNINELIEVSKGVNREDLTADLEALKARAEEPNKEIVIPLVGEFSSGKTTMLNALMDYKKLATASKATTATIFEIRFGAKNFYAEIIEKDGSVTRVETLEGIDPKVLEDAYKVKVYDTSTKIPSSTVLVDTPGLSSNVVEHRLTLTSYLPYADAIFLTIDVNQQLTRSLKDFLQDYKLTSKNIYVLITKADTKTKSEVQSQKDYWQKNIDLETSGIISLSSTESDFSEFDTLLAAIQKEKNSIVERSIEERVTSISESLLAYIDQILESLQSETPVDQQIKDLQTQLKRTKENINRWLEDAERETERSFEQYQNEFRRNIYNKLYDIVSNNRDSDDAVYQAVNTTAGILLENLKRDVKNTLIRSAKERNAKTEVIPIQSLEELDFSVLNFSVFDQNLGLSEKGHEYDKQIGYGAVAVAAAAALYLTGGGAALIGVFKKSGANKGLRDLLFYKINSGGDFKEEIAKIIKKLEEDKNKDTKDPQKLTGDQVTILETELSKLKDLDRDLVDYRRNLAAVEKKRGFIESSVGWITDNLIGKPARRKAVEGYIASDLMPAFNTQMLQVRDSVVNLVETLTGEEATNRTEQLEKILTQLEEEKQSEVEEYNHRLKDLNAYKELIERKTK